jgi:hypothetical protein
MDGLDATLYGGVHAENDTLCWDVFKVPIPAGRHRGDSQ